MCGFVGILSRHKKIPLALISAATGKVAHRGPDEQHFYTNDEGTVRFGHQRLCIIDLSAAAAQPMTYRGRYTIIYNGEIYNYIELKEELKSKGCSFTSASDTEVVVAAYAAYGEDCVQHFEGAFSFAIWDEVAQRLFAARDRFGEKPFYYYFDGSYLICASEMKSLWAAGIEKKVNNRMLYNFLTIGYTADPFRTSDTFYEDIYKLLPAYSMSFSLSDEELSLKKYWHIEIEENERITEEEAIEKCTELLNDSVKKRLRSDVPIGTSLSGGLDSSALVALCHATAADQYTHKCFTAVFPGFEKDESYYAALVAEKFNLTHIPVHIAPNGIEALMQKASLHLEEPFTSASALIQYEVYRHAKQEGVTVLLDGQGADEIFGGYNKYYKWQWQQLYREGRLNASGELEAARTIGVTESFGIKNKTAAFFPHFVASIHQASKKKQAFKQGDLNRDFAFANKEDLAYLLPTNFDLNNALYADTFNYGLEELLKLADRNSMAHGVEVRLPYLSHHLVSFLFTLPAHFKIHNGWTKWLLRKTAEPLLPQEITWRKDKVGFEPPQKVWMQQAEVQEAIKAAKEKLVRGGILDNAVLHKKVQPHDAHAAANSDWKYWSASFLFD